MNIENYKKFNLKNLNTFKIDAVGENVFFPKSEEELIYLLNNTKGIVIGNGSNILFSSHGIDEDLIFLKNFDKIEDKGDFVYVEAGVKSPSFSNYALENGFSGYEFLIAIPATVGGNIYMNSSAHNECISDYLVSVRAYDRVNKKVLELKKEEAEFSYRTSLFNKNPGRYVILGGTFKKALKNKDEIANLMEEIRQIRIERQPSLKNPNAGSTFKNPEGLSSGKLIEEIGFKGKKCGGAMVSTLHGNFMINENNATSDDIVNLMHEIQENVYNKFNVRLEPEIIYVGRKTEVAKKVWQK